MSKKRLKFAKITLFSILSIVLIFTSIPVANADFIFKLEGGVRRANIPQQYTVQNIVNDLGEEYGFMNLPEDIFIDKKGFIYICDTGNNRIIVLNPDCTVKNVITEIYDIPSEEVDPRYKDQPTTFNQPSGIYVDEYGDMFIADTMNERILHIEPDGKCIEMFWDPESQLLYSIVSEFKPTKLYVNNTGYIYLIKRHDLMSLDADNEFRGLTASGVVDFSITQLFARLFYTKTQRDKMFKPAPPAFTNFIIHDDGLIYATTLDQKRGEIKRINWVGENTYPQKKYGLQARTIDTIRDPYFVDVAVDQAGIIYALEKYNGYIYRYDPEGNILGLFGGIGDVKGRFKEPSSMAVDSYGNVYVLDKTANNLQVLQPTGFTLKVTAAVEMYQQGLYEESFDLWKEVLDVAGNYYVAHKGIAKAYYKKGLWIEAMDAYEKAGDAAGYSTAFNEYRHEIFRNNFVLVILCGIAIIVVVVWILSRLNWFSEDVVDYY
jgi:sugar lactone lactonase YvrE